MEKRKKEKTMKMIKKKVVLDSIVRNEELLNSIEKTEKLLYAETFKDEDGRMFNMKIRGSILNGVIFITRIEYEKEKLDVE